MLDERASAILQALVELHIRTGEPVSSRAILEATDLGVSGATIRNVVSKLEDDGFVHQPHTSAGRVPTDRGYRYYVDQLASVRLRSTLHVKIESFFSSIHDELDRLLQRTSQMLSDITHLPAVVTGPGIAADQIHAVHLVPVGGRMVVAVVVTESGRVTKEPFTLPKGAEVDDVPGAEELLGRICDGVDLAGAAAALSNLPRGEDGTPAADIARMAVAAAAGASADGSDVFLGGTSLLATLWGDLAKVQKILDLLEHQAELQELLADAEEGTIVRIGSELPIGDPDVALIASRYRAGAGADGKLGVLGPARLDYRRTIGVVEEVSETLGEMLEQ